MSVCRCDIGQIGPTGIAGGSGKGTTSRLRTGTKDRRDTAFSRRSTGRFRRLSDAQIVGSPWHGHFRLGHFRRRSSQTNFFDHRRRQTVSRTLERHAAKLPQNRRGTSENHAKSRAVKIFLGGTFHRGDCPLYL